MLKRAISTLTQHPSGIQSPRLDRGEYPLQPKPQAEIPPTRPQAKNLTAKKRLTGAEAVSTSAVVLGTLIPFSASSKPCHVTYKLSSTEKLFIISPSELWKSQRTFCQPTRRTLGCVDIRWPPGPDEEMSPLMSRQQVTRKKVWKEPRVVLKSEFGRSVFGQFDTLQLIKLCSVQPTFVHWDRIISYSSQGGCGDTPISYPNVLVFGWGNFFARFEILLPRRGGWGLPTLQFCNWGRGGVRRTSWKSLIGKKTHVEWAVDVCDNAQLRLHWIRSFHSLHTRKRTRLSSRLSAARRVHRLDDTDKPTHMASLWIILDNGTKDKSEAAGNSEFSEFLLSEVFRHGSEGIWKSGYSEFLNFPLSQVFLGGGCNPENASSSPTLPASRWDTANQYHPTIGW